MYTTINKHKQKGPLGDSLIFFYFIPAPPESPNITQAMPNLRPRCRGVYVEVAPYLREAESNTHPSSLFYNLYISSLRSVKPISFAPHQQLQTPKRLKVRGTSRS